jgi:hypothetical protein
MSSLVWYEMAGIWGLAIVVVLTDLKNWRR